MTYLPIANMKSRLYHWNETMLALARRKMATAWLAFFAFIESIFFPIPIDPMLAVMVLARPSRFVFLAMVATLFSTLGGVLGWFIGYESGLLMVEWLGKTKWVEVVRDGFHRHGWLLILIGAYTPFPYKITVITGGFLGVGLVPLIITSLIGRGTRYLLVASIIRYRANRVALTMLGGVFLLLMAMCWWVLTL